MTILHIRRSAMVLLILVCKPDPIAAGAREVLAETRHQSGSVRLVEEKMLINGYRRYQGTCSHCHGPDGVGGSFAPSLIETLLPYETFRSIVEEGSATGTSVMLGFAGDRNVMDHVDDIYAYLSARSMGKIGRGRPTF